MGGLRSVVSDGQISVWDLEAANAIASFKVDDNIYACALAGDGQTIVAETSSGVVYVLAIEP